MQYKNGEKVFGDWVIVREIGQGAFGTVYEIHKLDIDYGVPAKSALKVVRIPRNESDVKAILNEGMDEQSVTAYFQGVVDEIIKEISIMSSLKGHSNIVSYEDHCVMRFDEGIGWEILIRMELLSSLQDHVRNHVMDERETIRLGIDICSALVHCQKKGMIHRDIKPENIFVNESGQFKLGDFGIARTLEKTTGGLSKKGTEGYMAPEVYKGRHYGANVDVYSLGLVLYKFMNGNRLPFLPSAPQPIKFTDRERALEKRMAGEALPFPEYGSAEFAEIILKACSFQKDMRYHTAEEMLEDLKTVYYSLDGSGDGGGGLTDGGDPPPPPPPPKVPIVLIIVGFLLILIILITVVIMVPKNIYKHVNVENGVGTGDYVVGSTVTVTADEPDDGYEFVEWTIENGSVELSDSNEATVSFKMPKQEVSLSPVYQKKGEYTLTVKGGTGSGTYVNGTQVEIQAGEPGNGYIFSRWSVFTQNVKLSNTYSETSSFIMPREDVVIVAEYSVDEILADDNQNLASATDIAIGDTVIMGTYEQDGNTLNGSEKIEWIVLDKDETDNKMLLISKYNLECMQYNKVRIEMSWEDCTLRNWLNNTFIYEAFTVSEQEHIITVQHDNEDNPVYGVEGGRETYDRVFLLSATEALRYFPSDESRRAYSTPYVKAAGAVVDETYGTSWWWVRTPGDEKLKAACVYYDGTILYEGRAVDNVLGGRSVRPALWVSLE